MITVQVAVLFSSNLSLMAAQVAAVPNGTNGVAANGKANGKAVKSKNQLRRLKAKAKKQAQARRVCLVHAPCI